MIPTSELTKGCLILTDAGLKNKVMVRSIVESWNEEFVILQSERKVKIADCEGIKLDDHWWKAFGFEKINDGWCKPGYDKMAFVDLDGWKYVHEIQEIWFRKTGTPLEVIIKK